MQPSASNRLFVFDFDHTLIDANSDTIIYELFQGGKLPTHLSDAVRSTQWTKFMQMVTSISFQTFDEFHKLGITRQQVRKVIRSAQLTVGMRQLLDYLKKEGYTCIIASDSNTFFIEEILQEQALKQHFAGVFTNPLTFQGQLLQVWPYQEHDCKRCPINICKSTIVRYQIIEFRQFLAKNSGKFDKLYYAGDGSNDLCPCLELGMFCYCRDGYSLQKLVEKHQLTKSLTWTTGSDILEHIKQQL